MIVLRDSTFSSKSNKKKSDKKEREERVKKVNRSAAVNAAAGAGLAVGGLGANKALGIHLYKDAPWAGNAERNPKLAEENARLFEKLKQGAEKQGIKVKATEGADLYSGYAVPYKKNGKAGGDWIQSGKSADVLSHEIGHAQHYKGRKASMIGKAAHRLDALGRTQLKGVAVGSFVNGVHSGVVAKRQAKKGKKESAFNRHKSWAVPTAVMAPVVVAEAAASRKGYKLLKNAGASKEYLKQARRSLLKAGGTYAGMAAIPVGAGEVGRAVGKVIEN